MLQVLILLSVLFIYIANAYVWAESIPYGSLRRLKKRGTYDFIVIGAGTSGSVLATRLALHPSHPSVLLLEAGTKANVSSSSYQMVPPVSFDCQLTSIDWQYKTVPQSNCCSALINNQSLWPRGKVCGGTGVFNTMFYVYGHPNDWDQIMNVNGWKSKDVLPFYHKLESFHPYPYNAEYNGNRGKNGPIEVNEARNLLTPQTSFLVDKFIEACTKTGYQFIDDINDWETNKDQTGCHYAQNNIEYESGLRINSFVGYMKYLLNTKEFKDGKINLDILPNAHVTKILFQNHNNKYMATGVQFTYYGKKDKTYTVKLSSLDKGELILSAGTVGTPHLLMLSGIGPSNELTKHDIPIIEDIKGIGQNLQDHIFVLTRFALKEEYYNTTVIANTISENIKTSVLEANAFINTPLTDNKYPDIKFHLLRAAGFDPKYLNFNPSDNLMKCGPDKYYDPENLNHQQFIGSTILEHPKSIGEITLSSADPYEHPIIDPKYLSDKHDLDTLTEGYKLFVELFNNMDDVWEERLKCLQFGDIDNDDNALEEWIKATVLTQWHPVGTCKMGNQIDMDKDDSIVVNERLQLRNIGNVRVADASIIPKEITGNPQSSCYMIGERAAKFVLDEWVLKNRAKSEL